MNTQSNDQKPGEQDEPGSTLPDTLPDNLPPPQDSKQDKPRLGQMLVCSLVSGSPTEAQLKTLNDRSAHNNRNRGLTGVLLHGNGVFVHWLEGATDYLAAAWKSISQDGRHEKLVVLWESQDAPERLFGDWFMGLRSPIVARDLLEVLRTTKRLHTPKTMLRANYYDVFIDALEMLERAGAADADSTHQSGLSRATNHTLLGPARHVVKRMGTAGFIPYTVSPKAAPKKRDHYAQLSSLDTGAPSVFKSSMPMEQEALIDLSSPDMDDLLTMLDMPLRIALGQALWSRRTELFKRPLHWTFEDKLVAVFDHETWRVGLHPELTAAAFEDAVLVERLRSANDIPALFRQTTSYALFWDYAKSDLSQDVKLPARFLTRRIRLRRKPPVPELMLQPGQKQLMTLLSKGPERLVDLAQSLGLQPEGMISLLRPFYASRTVDVIET